MPEGEGESLRSIHTYIEFTGEVENSAITADGNCMLDVDVSLVEFSLVNSRKLAVRCMVDMECQVVGEITTEMVCDITGDMDVQMQKKEVEMYSIVSAQSTSFELSETLDFPAGKPTASCILKMDAKVYEKDVKAVTGKVIVKGVVGLCTLYVSCDNNCIEFMEHEIPFTEVIDAPGATEDCNIDTDIIIADCCFEPRLNQDGELRLIDVCVTLNAKVIITCQTAAQIVDDCYVPGYKTTADTTICKIDSVAGMGRMQHTLRDIIRMDADTPEVSLVYNLIAKPIIGAVRSEKNKVSVEGVMDCYVLYLSPNEVSPVASIKKQLPFMISLDVSGADEGMYSDVKAELANASYSLTMAGEIEVRCIMNISVRVIQSEEIKLIRNIEISEIDEITRPGMVIYFVQKGDTLWNIAKHYGVSLDELIRINKLDPAAPIMPGQQLLIPMRTKRAV